MKRNKKNEYMMQKTIAHNQNRKRAKFAALKPSEKASEIFRTPSFYQAQSLVKAQGEQMERNDVLGYMDKLGHDVKGEMLIEKEDS